MQRLPNIAHIRSLNIPFIGDHVTTKFDPKELALQILDMIYLRPEIELCYLGISNKCFEISEGCFPEDSSSQGDVVQDEATEDEDDASEMDSDDDDDEDSDEDETTAAEAVEAVDGDYDHSDTSDWSGDESDNDSDPESNKLSLRLREILFYDDKVAIFKARHMKL